MTIDPKLFGEQFSELANSLQTALALASERAAAARAETAESDQLFAAVSRAVEAAHQLRIAGAAEKGE